MEGQSPYFNFKNGKCDCLTVRDVSKKFWLDFVGNICITSQIRLENLGQLDWFETDFIHLMQGETPVAERRGSEHFAGRCF